MVYRFKLLAVSVSQSIRTLPIFVKYGTIDPLQLGSGDHTTFFLEHFYITGYNLKNARNGKSASKITKWSLSLRSPALKNENF